MRDSIRLRTNGDLRRTIRGYTLIEVILVMIIISIIAAVSMKSLRHVDEDQRVQQTIGAMNRLADAVAGDPDLVSGGSRIDYGYVGDVGGLPTNLDALVSNPGLGTWDGPYLQDEFYASSGGAATSFKQDAWGQAYSFGGGVTITSTGGPGTLTRDIAGSVDDLLHNQLTAVVTDRNDSPPGAVQKDSVKLVLTYPNGSGGYTNRSVYPGAGGYLEFDSIPIGQHTLRLVHEPTNDTLSRLISVDPGASPHVDFRYYAEVWGDTSSGGGGGGSGIETLRPSGPGNATDLDDSSCSSNWQCVDEVSTDDDATFVYRAANTYRTDTYTLTDPGVSTGTIDSVVAHCAARTTKVQGDVQPTLFTGSTEYNGSAQSLTGSYVDYRQVWPSNPSTSAAWSWAEIDDLQAGVRMRGQNSVWPAYCTQVWVEVFYTN